MLRIERIGLKFVIHDWYKTSDGGCIPDTEVFVGIVEPSGDTWVFTPFESNGRFKTKVFDTLGEAFVAAENYKPYC